MFGKAHGPRICNFACLEFQIHNGLIIVGLWGLYRSVPTSQHRSKHIGYQTLLAPPIHSSMRVQHHKSGGSWKLREPPALCMYMYMYVYVYVFMCIYIYIYLHLHFHMHMHMDMDMDMYMYICIGKCICICKCICRCKCRCICICTRIRFTYIYIYTYVCVSVFRYRDRCRCTRCICKGICIGMGISMKYVFCIHIEKGNKCEKMIQPTFLLCRYCARILPTWPCSEFPFAHLF